MDHVFLLGLSIIPKMQLSSQLFMAAIYSSWLYSWLKEDKKHDISWGKRLKIHCLKQTMVQVGFEPMLSES